MKEKEEYSCSRELRKQVVLEKDKIKNLAAKITNSLGNIFENEERIGKQHRLLDEMANKIIAVLKYPALKETLASYGNFEARRLRWKDSAAKCAKIYEQLLVAV